MSNAQDFISWVGWRELPFLPHKKNLKTIVGDCNMPLAMSKTLKLKWVIINKYLLYFYIHLCMHASACICVCMHIQIVAQGGAYTYMDVHAFMPWHMFGGERITCSHWFSPHIMWIQKDGTWVIRLWVKCLYLLRHFTSSQDIQLNRLS